MDRHGKPNGRNQGEPTGEPFLHGDEWQQRYRQIESHGTAFEGSEGWVKVDRSNIQFNPENLVDLDEAGFKDRLLRSPSHVRNFLTNPCLPHECSRFIAAWLAGWLVLGSPSPGANAAPPETVGVHVASNSASGLAWRRQAGSVALLQKDQVLWQFNFGTNEAKPCFHPLAPPGCPVLTGYRPPDHPWHRGLWFSWKYINGTNYWEEDAKTGLSQGRTEWQAPHIETRADFSARLVMDLSYRPADAAPVLTEHRVIEVAAPDPGGVLRQDWDMTFRAGDREVVLDRTHLPEDPGGGHSWGGYAGLGIRFARPLDEVRAITAAGTLAEFVEGRYRGKSPAMDYSGLLDGHEVGLAILDYPANLNSPTPWYAVKDDVMSYLSPAVLTYGPVTLHPGQTLRLRYRLFLHPGRWGAAQLRQAETDRVNGLQ